MSEEDYNFPRPTHSYGTRFVLRLREQFGALTIVGEEQFGPFSPPPNLPNSPRREGIESSGPSSPIQLGTVPTSITPLDQIVDQIRNGFLYN